MKAAQKITCLFTSFICTLATLVVFDLSSAQSALQPEEFNPGITHVATLRPSRNTRQPKPHAALSSASLASLTTTLRYVTAPDDLPLITITVPASNTAPGYLFFASFGSTQGKTSYLLILDDQGEVVYYRPDSHYYLTDFKRQPTGSLTFFSGEGYLATAYGEYSEMNASYDITATWQFGAPDLAEVHDLQLIPGGRALLMTYEHKERDLSAYGGLTNTIFADTVIQEVDSARNVYFNWRLIDHFPITATYLSLTTAVVDHSHGNAVELDTDGNMLLSSRHLSEITKINRQTGQVMWHLGGKQNEFNFVNDGGFSFQHDIRRLPNGNISLWDNGNQKIPPYSRAVEYEIDEVSKVITRVWEYRNTPDVFSAFMGNVQTLENGNRFLGWGGPRNLISEIGADGSKRFEMTMDASHGVIYRAFRFPWQGFPATTPTLVITDVVSGAPTLYYSWNGATEIAFYRVESSPVEGLFTRTLTQTRTGFETSTPLANLPADLCFVRVMPVDKQGQDTRYSNIIYLDKPACQPKLQLDTQPQTQLVLLGSPVTLTQDVLNIGATSLHNVAITTTPSIACTTPNTTTIQPISSADLGILSYTCNIASITSDMTLTTTAAAQSDIVSPSLTLTDVSIVSIKVITPSLSISMTPNSQVVLSGGTISFTIVVRNTGNSTFNQLRITAPNAPDCDFDLDGPLPPGASLRYGCTQTGVAHTFTNTLTAIGTIASGQSTVPTITTTASSSALVQVPKHFLPLIVVSKFQTDAGLMRVGLGR